MFAINNVKTLSAIYFWLWKYVHQFNGFATKKKQWKF